MDLHQAQLERIKIKLGEAKRADFQCKVFGANRHKYRLGKPASAQAVEQFENQYSIQLPEGYKAFMLNIGNGGESYANSAAGPYYGIYPLGENVNELIFSETEKYIHKPSVIFPDMSDDYWKTLNQSIEENESITDEEYESEIGKIFGGLLPIGSQGCTYIHAIVINGMHKGRVVNVDLDRQKPHFTFENNFLDWYERWLDEVISGQLITKSPSGFGYSRRGEDNKLPKTK